MALATRGVRAVSEFAASACTSLGRGDLPVLFEDVARAQALLRDYVRKSTCFRSTHLSNLTGMNLYLKAELQQVSGSFKERGARFALENLNTEQKCRGVIAASAGNHALALAYHGNSMGVPVTVLMPTSAPLAKVQKCRLFGANVVLGGDHIGDCKLEASTNEEYADLVYINGYDDVPVIAGAGTIGLECIDQCPQMDALVVPCGGGGLLAGMGLAVKTLSPSCEVFAVEPKNCNSFTSALQAGKPIETETTPTLADGLAVPKVGDNAFEIARYYTDYVCEVDEMEIAKAILRCLEEEKLTVEGGGATGLAALLPGGPLHEKLQGKTVCTPLCGGNIDVTTLGRVLDRGLAADGRLVRFVSVVSDSPGGIAGLTKLLYENGASIKDIYHERAWLHTAIDYVQVKCIIELRSNEHGEEVRAALEQRYPTVWGAHASPHNVLLQRQTV